MMEEAILMLRKAQGNKEIQRKKCKTAMNVQASWKQLSTILTIILQCFGNVTSRVVGCSHRYPNST